MRGTAASGGFTMAEMMIAMMGSTIILAALLMSSMQLQRALYASERLATKQTEQRRLMDYLGRDLRRAIGISSTTTVNGSGGTRIAAGTVLVEDGVSLVASLPGYYQTNARDRAEYDEALPIVVADQRVDYGTEEGHAPQVRVLFRKQYVEAEKSECFLRIEGEGQTVMVREAKDLHLSVAIAAEGRLCTIDVTYTPTGRGNTPRVSSHDEILLRNVRTD